MKVTLVLTAHCTLNSDLQIHFFAIASMHFIHGAQEDFWSQVAWGPTQFCMKQEQKVAGLKFLRLEAKDATVQSFSCAECVHLEYC